jgi:hypothetical protein
MTIEAIGKTWFGLRKSAPEVIEPTTELVYSEAEAGIIWEQKRIIVDSPDQITILPYGQEPVTLYKQEINDKKVSIPGPGINPSCSQSTHIRWRDQPRRSCIFLLKPVRSCGFRVRNKQFNYLNGDKLKLKR